MGQDLLVACRRLLATPVFTVFAILSLGVGVGVTTAVYSVVDAIFLKDLGIHDPKRVAFVVTPYDGQLRMLKRSISTSDFQHLRAAQQSFSSLSASASFHPAVVSASTTEILAAEAVDASYFPTLGVSAALGRAIQALDDARAASVVVLSDGLWRMRFAADPAIVGRTIRIAGHPFEVVGVAPASFEGATGNLPGTRLWVPLATQGSLPVLVVGRLKPGVDVSAASAEMAAIAAALDRSFPPASRARHPGATERPWRAKSASTIAADDSILHRFGLTLVALVGLVLVVACTNLANLVLARGTTRQQELAVRYALGAPRWRLVREQCAESLLLAAAGAVASCLVFLGLRQLMNVEFNLTLPMGGRWLVAIRPQLDMTALGLAAASLAISLLVFGLEPALQLTRSSNVAADMVGGVGRPRAKRQRTLLRWQVAISSGFFIIATMFVEYTIKEARHDSGVEMDRLGIAVLNFQTQGWDEARVRSTLERVTQEARKDPAVDAVSISTGMPFGLFNPIRLTISRPDGSVDARDSERASGIAVTPSVFRTIGVPILLGRGFDERDHATAAPVVVLSEFTARRLFGTASPLGRQLTVEGLRARDVTVVGVARDTDVGMLMWEPRAFVYVPLTQRYDPRVTVAVRSRGDAGIAVAALRTALRAADPDLAVEAIGTGRTILAGPWVFLRAAGMTALALGGVTLLLAMAGLFGIQSHIVSRRTQEIGVRMALGATPRLIRRMVLRDGCRPVLEGLGLGLFIGVTGRAIVRAYIELETSTPRSPLAMLDLVDPWMLVLLPVPMVLAAVCACYLPARRAAAVAPNVALRHL